MNETTVGIDVGGPAKGFHAVALRGRELASKRWSQNATEIAEWCARLSASVVAVDSPCKWRGIGRPARAAERQLARDGISCFSTPTEENARGHPFYTWMFAGMEMFHALAESHPLYLEEAVPGAVTIETFPQAVACALAGKIVSAKEKNRVRRELLTQAGINDRAFVNIDEIDAALCALAAEAFARRAFHGYGDAEGGFIIVPAGPRRDSSTSRFERPVTKARSTPMLTMSQIIATLPSLSAADRKTLRDHLEALERFPAVDEDFKE